MLKNLTNPVLCHSLFGWCLGCWTIKRDFLAAADVYSIFLIRQPSPILKRSNRIIRHFQLYSKSELYMLVKYRVIKILDKHVKNVWYWVLKRLAHLLLDLSVLKKLAIMNTFSYTVTSSHSSFLTNTKMFCMLQQREWMKWFYQDFRSTVMTQ